MKKQIIFIALASISLWSVAGEPRKVGKNNENVKVNTQESTLKWHATKVTGEHFGTINVESGELQLTGNNLTGGVFTIDMSSITNTDLPAEYKAKLEGHLKSDDFFSTEKFKNSVLKIKSVSAIKNAKPGTDNYTITADLTIKGITKEITFPSMVVVSKDKVIANSSIDINRAAYDVRYGSKTFFESIGDKAIDDVFNIKVRLIAQR